jgi:hypothetical protein
MVVNFGPETESVHFSDWIQPDFWLGLNRFLLGNFGMKLSRFRIKTSRISELKWVAEQQNPPLGARL